MARNVVKPAITSWRTVLPRSLILKKRSSHDDVVGTAVLVFEDIIIILPF
jgi:hypothetical protein